MTQLNNKHLFNDKESSNLILHIHDDKDEIYLYVHDYIITKSSKLIKDMMDLVYNQLPHEIPIIPFNVNNITLFINVIKSLYGYELDISRETLTELWNIFNYLNINDTKLKHFFIFDVAKGNFELTGLINYIKENNFIFDAIGGEKGYLNLIIDAIVYTKDKVEYTDDDILDVLINISDLNKYGKQVSKILLRMKYNTSLNKFIYDHISNFKDYERVIPTNAVIERYVSIIRDDIMINRPYYKYPQYKNNNLVFDTRSSYIYSVHNKSDKTYEIEINNKLYKIKPYETTMINENFNWTSDTFIFKCMIC